MNDIASDALKKQINYFIEFCMNPLYVLRFF